MFSKQLNKINNLIQNIKNSSNISIISDFLDWFLEVLNLSFNKKYKNFTPNKWEIYFVNLWKNIWSELNKNRPCIIYSNYFLNNWDNIIIIPLKSYKWKNNRNINIFIWWTKLNWLIKDSIVDLMWIRQISKKRVSKLIWKVDKKIIFKIDNKLLKILNIKK